MRVASSGDTTRVEAASYVVTLADERPFVEVTASDGRRIGRLNPIGAVDTTAGLDGTAGIGVAAVEQRPGEVTVTLPIESTRWRAKRAVIACRDDEVGLRVEVEGDGSLADVRLLGGWYPTDRRWGAGWYRSWIAASTLVSAA
ncbi:MAG TPA: hypothetical protein VFR93_02110, partial [Candidatus Limnocylindrales bacterium]|nr:hypothetical protein [Candidatus Limnocylindrales bacterium]